MVLKLSSVRADISAEEAGQWIDYAPWPGVSFHVRSTNSQSFVTARLVALRKLAEKHNGADETIPPEEMAAAVGALLAEHLLIGWQGVDVPYTPEAALEHLTDVGHRDLRNAVEWCGAQVAKIVPAFEENQAKN